MATIQLPPDVEPFVLAKAAGSAVAPTLDGITLTVPDVDQTSLDGALAAYDPAAVHAGHLRDALAAKRWAVETGGTTWNTWPVATGRDDRISLDAEYNAAKDAVRTDGEMWKFADGQFRALTNAQVIDMALAVRTFVKNCFAVEGQKLQLIAQGLDPAIDAGWPV
jgi:hypothetical protein